MLERQFLSGLFSFLFKKKSNLHTGKLFYKLALEHQDIFPGVQLLQILF